MTIKNFKSLLTATSCAALLTGFAAQNGFASQTEKQNEPSVARLAFEVQQLKGLLAQSFDGTDALVEKLKLDALRSSNELQLKKHAIQTIQTQEFTLRANAEEIQGLKLTGIKNTEEIKKLQAIEEQLNKTMKDREQYIPTTEHNLVVENLNGVRSELEETQGGLTTAQKKNETLTERNTKLDKDLEDVRKIARELRSEKDELNSSLEGAQSENEELKETARNFGIRMEKEAVEKNKFHKENERLKKIIEELRPKEKETPELKEEKEPGAEFANVLKGFKELAERMNLKGFIEKNKGNFGEYCKYLGAFIKPDQDSETVKSALNFFAEKLAEEYGDHNDLFTGDHVSFKHGLQELVEAMPEEEGDEEEVKEDK